MKSAYKTVFASVLVALSGCAGTGGSGGGGGGGAPAATQESIDYGSAKMAIFKSVVSSGDLPISYDLPTSGDAYFSGPMTIVGAVASDFGPVLKDYIAHGQVYLNADFTSDSVNGYATSFGVVTSNNGKGYDLSEDFTLLHTVDGTLDIRGGLIGLSGFGNAQMEGTLIGMLGPDSNSTTEIDTSLFATFYAGGGSGADVIFGGGFGSAVTNGYSSGIATQFLAD